MNWKKWLVKQAYGSIFASEAMKQMIDSPVPEVWDEGKQKTIDSLVANLPPLNQKVPIRAGTARLASRMPPQ